MTLIKPLMKRLIVFIALFFSLTGCKKNIEKIQEDLVVKAMTDGQWHITSFVNNGTDITADFSNYRFKYYYNPNKVDAINNGIIEKTGTWDGSATTMSTSANFTAPAYPLSLINGTWLINNNSWTYVAATQVNGLETKTMRLDKL